MWTVRRGPKFHHSLQAGHLHRGQANMGKYALLSKRTGPRPATNKAMPHSQIGMRPDPEVNAELFRRALALPDVENRPTVNSVPGARSQVGKMQVSNKKGVFVLVTAQTPLFFPYRTRP